MKRTGEMVKGLDAVNAGDGLVVGGKFNQVGSIPDAPMKWREVQPRPNEARRYITNRGYSDGSYIITQGHRGSWAVWIIENLGDRQGWRLVGSCKTSSAARRRAEMHRIERGAADV